jgi:hypothetical protein
MATNTPDFKSFSKKQLLFIRYVTAILIDLTVLNLFNEYWINVQISSFSISLLVAIVLQLMLQITFKIEHGVGSYLLKEGRKGLRIFTAWALLFGSKFAILWVLELLFDDKIMFKGPVHGIVAFIIVIITMVVTEGLMKWITIVALSSEKKAGVKL